MRDYLCKNCQKHIYAESYDDGRPLLFHRHSNSFFCDYTFQTHAEINDDNTLRTTESDAGD